MLPPLTPAQQQLRQRAIRLFNTRMKSGEAWDSPFGTVMLYALIAMVAFFLYREFLPEWVSWRTLSLERRFWLIWFTTLLGGGVPMFLFYMIKVRRGQRQLRRALKGQCYFCGYDLRETPDRCPECGHDNTDWTVAVRPITKHGLPDDVELI